MRVHPPSLAAKLAALLLLALALLPHALLAKVQNKRRPAAHAHPEVRSKKRDSDARKRVAEDRKQRKKAGREAKHRQAQPVNDRARGKRRARAMKTAQGSGPVQAHAHARTRAQSSLAKSSAAPDAEAPRADAATESRVHAWVNARQGDKAAQISTDPHTATSADFVNAAGSSSEAPAAGDTKKDSSTGTSNPPPDRLQATQKSRATVNPVSVVGLVRGTPGVRPQLPPVEDLVAEPVILPALYTRRGRLVVPPPMKGSHEILIRQNQMADDEGLDRIQNDDDLDRLRASGLLIAIPSNLMLHVDERLPVNRRYCRPWTALFLDTLARQHYARFQTTLQLTSAVRTVEFQQQLIQRNGNAAPAEGDTASPHLTGQAVDIGKKGLSVAEIAWLRGYLLPLVQQGKVDVEEEFQQSCFHISVYKKYLPRVGAGRRSIATSRGRGLDVLATGLP